MVKINKKKGQSFSADILVVIIIVLFGALFLVMNQINDVEEGGDINEKYELATVESNMVYNDLKKDEIIDSENNVNIQKLLQINNQELKEELNLKNDFAIVFEKDGKLVKIDPENDVFCIGSQEVIVNGEICQ